MKNPLNPSMPQGTQRDLVRAYNASLLGSPDQISPIGSAGPHGCFLACIDNARLDEIGNLTYSWKEVLWTADNETVDITGLASLTTLAPVHGIMMALPMVSGALYQINDLVLIRESLVGGCGLGYTIVSPPLPQPMKITASAASGAQRWVYTATLQKHKENFVQGYDEFEDATTTAPPTTDALYNVSEQYVPSGVSRSPAPNGTIVLATPRVWKQGDFWYTDYWFSSNNALVDTTGTAGQVWQVVGGGAPPAWSTATYPAAISIGTVLVCDAAANAIVPLAPPTADGQFALTVTRSAAGTAYTFAWLPITTQCPPSS